MFACSCPCKPFGKLFGSPFGEPFCKVPCATPPATFALLCARLEFVALVSLEMLAPFWEVALRVPCDEFGSEKSSKGFLSSSVKHKNCASLFRCRLVCWSISFSKLTP